LVTYSLRLIYDWVIYQQNLADTVLGGWCLVVHVPQIVILSLLIML